MSFGIILYVSVVWQRVFFTSSPIEHPLVDPRTTSICLITKDPQREYKDLLESKNIKFISRVVGIAKLKGKFKAFEARRLLLKENGLFLADDRVIPLLPKLLGSKWFEAKKCVCLLRFSICTILTKVFFLRRTIFFGIFRHLILMIVHLSFWSKTTYPGASYPQRSERWTRASHLYNVYAPK